LYLKEENGERKEKEEGRGGEDRKRMKEKRIETHEKILVLHTPSKVS
jgi:hypothetical protein